MATVESEITISDHASDKSDEKEVKEKTVCARLVLTKEQVLT